MFSVIQDGSVAYKRTLSLSHLVKFRALICLDNVWNWKYYWRWCICPYWIRSLICRSKSISLILVLWLNFIYNSFGLCRAVCFDAFLWFELSLCVLYFWRASSLDHWLEYEFEIRCKCRCSVKSVDKLLRWANESNWPQFTCMALLIGCLWLCKSLHV